MTYDEWRAEARRRQAFGECFQVLLKPQHGRVDLVGDPAGELQAAGLDGFGGEEGVVDAAEAHAHHQDHCGQDRGERPGEGGAHGFIILAQRVADDVNPGRHQKGQRHGRYGHRPVMFGASMGRALADSAFTSG